MSPDPGSGVPADPVLPEGAAAVLGAVEAGLDPAHPADSGLQVLAYGEVSCALVVPGLAGWVAKRMAGLADLAAAQSYLGLLADYLAELARVGITAVATHPVLVPRGARPPVVYLLQPELATPGLGATVLREAGDADVAAAIQAVLDRLDRLRDADRGRAPGDQVAVDAQLSNWWFDPALPVVDAEPVLIDVGTPFVRRAGRHAIGAEMFLAAVPPGLRAYYRRKGEVEAYLDDYFSPRTCAVDLLGNMFKEGRADRVPLGIAVVNDWLAAVEPNAAPVTLDEVADYYRADAAQLALFLRVRRLDRARSRLIRRRYDFVLPGAIAR
jgi:hypothetical protein